METLTVILPPPDRPVTREEVIASRQAVGLTPTEFARALGVEPQTVFNWERGSTQPPHPRMWRWAVKALGRSAVSPGGELDPSY
jgi:DNA-binding transcriptional regulator YiaG